MLEALKGLGCELDLDTVVDCHRCNIAATGGFIPNVGGEKEGAYKPKVVVCEDNLLGPHYVAQTLAHELVHAYDQCRAKINWRSCYHYACTEVCVCVCVCVWTKSVVVGGGGGGC
jgi:mitochondrial inner membrane protease ATP23